MPSLLASAPVYKNSSLWDTREISFWVNQDLEVLKGGDAVVLLGFGGFVCLFLVFLVFFTFCLFGFF